MVGHGRHIFEIPVYRCSQEQYLAERDRELEKYILGAFPYSKPSDEARERLKWHFLENKWPCWSYNQVIGWLKLWVEPRTILAEHYVLKAKALRRQLRSKTYMWNTYKAIEVRFCPEQTDKEIFDALRAELVALQRPRRTVFRYIDLDVFDRTGPHVAWRRLIGFD